MLPLRALDICHNCKSRALVRAWAPRPRATPPPPSDALHRLDEQGRSRLLAGISSQRPRVCPRGPRCPFRHCQSRAGRAVRRAQTWPGARARVQTADGSHTHGRARPLSKQLNQRALGNVLFDLPGHAWLRLLARKSRFTWYHCETTRRLRNIFMHGKPCTRPAPASVCLLRAARPVHSNTAQTCQEWFHSTTERAPWCDCSPDACVLRRPLLFSGPSIGPALPGSCQPPLPGLDRLSPWDWPC